MAEIRVEKKRGSANWIWLLVLLVVVVGVVVYLWYSGNLNLGAAQQDVERQLTAVMEAPWRAMTFV